MFSSRYSRRFISHHCLFLVSLTSPKITISERAPTQLRANWDDINLPVDSWIVKITRTAEGSGWDDPVSEVKVLFFCL